MIIKEVHFFTSTVKKKLKTYKMSNKKTKAQKD